MYKNRKSITQLARELRKNMTPSERLLWAELRNRKLKEFKFVRQYPIIHDAIPNRLLFFIADFYCAQKKLVVELDGKIHDSQKDYDNWRDVTMLDMNFKVLRIKNEDLVNMPAVLGLILSRLEE